MRPAREPNRIPPDAAVQWYRKARTACEAFMFAEARFRTPWVDDEFAEGIRVARQWLRDNPSPDDALGEHFVTMLEAYAEMTVATVGRVMELREIIEREMQALDLWESSAALSAPPASCDLNWREPVARDGKGLRLSGAPGGEALQFQGREARIDQYATESSRRDAAS
jgi:hypothetical protein